LIEDLFDSVTSLERCSQRLNLFKLFQVSDEACAVAGRDAKGFISTAPGRRFYSSKLDVSEVNYSFVALVNAVANDATNSLNPRFYHKLLALLALSMNDKIMCKTESNKTNLFSKVKELKNGETLWNENGIPIFTPFSFISLDKRYIGINVLKRTIESSAKEKLSLPNGCFMMVTNSDGERKYYTIVVDGEIMAISNDPYNSKKRGTFEDVKEIVMKDCEFYMVMVDTAFDQGDNLIIRSWNNDRSILNRDEYELLPGGQMYV